MGYTVLFGAWLALLAGGAVETDPAIFLRNLLGPAEARLAALRSLEIEGDLRVLGPRLTAVQMDTDAELEAVLVLDVETARHVVVFDRRDGVWWVVDRFALLDGSGVDLREVVEAGASDLVIEEAAGGAGGGLAQTELSVYHLVDGRLLRVYAAVSFVSVCADESRRVEFPRAESGERGYVVERLTANWQSRRAPPVCGKAKPVLQRCTAYRWDPEAGRMVADGSAVGARRCRGRRVDG